MIGVDQTWAAANQRRLSAALAEVRAALQRHAAVVGQSSVELAEDAPHSMPLADAPNPPAALDTLCTLFGLSPFERDLLLLCAGMDLDARVAGLCAAAAGDARLAYPTFSLALAALPAAHWSALTPGAPLRYWRLIEVGGGDALVSSPLRVDEWTLHYLAGAPYFDDRLADLVAPVPVAAALVSSQQALAARVAAVWAAADSAGADWPVVQLYGEAGAGKTAVAAAACAELGLVLYRLPVRAIPVSAAERAGLVRLWERQALVGGYALLLAADDTPPDAAADHARTDLIARLHGPLIVTGRDPFALTSRTSVSFAVGKPAGAEQTALWQAALGATAPALNGHVARLVGQFNLSAAAIQAAAPQAVGSAPDESPVELADRLWAAARAAARGPLDDLAQRLDPAAGWADLVLPEAPMRGLAGHCRPCGSPRLGLRHLGLGGQRRARPGHQRAVRRAERYRQDAGRRSAGRRTTARSLSHRPERGGQQIYRRDREESAPCV